jgi:hypothetical protein
MGHTDCIVSGSQYRSVRRLAAGDPDVRCVDGPGCRGCQAHGASLGDADRHAATDVYAYVHTGSMADGDRNEYIGAGSATYRHLDSPAHAHTLTERHANPLPPGDRDTNSHGNSHTGTHAHTATDFHCHAAADFHAAKQPDTDSQSNNAADLHGDAESHVYLDAAAKRDVYGLAYDNPNANQAGHADPFADGRHRRGGVHSQP